MTGVRPHLPTPPSGHRGRDRPQRFTRTAATLAATAMLGVTLGACSSGTPAPASVDRASCGVPRRTRREKTDEADGVVHVGTEFVDRHRTTPATPTRPRRPCRVLPVQIRLPRGTRPEPMIVVAHGLDGDPEALADLDDAWARAGYVVVAPMFPTTVKDPAGDSSAAETRYQSGDLRFVIDRMLAGDRRRGSRWFGRVDPGRIGAAGMSLGGLAVYAATTESCCTDGRIDAAVLMAAVHRDVPDSQQHHKRIPMMLLQGDVDPGYHNSRDAYSDLVPPKWFVTLHGSRHAPPFEVPRGPEGAVVDATTTAFWDRSLRADPTGTARIAAAVHSRRSTTTLQVDLGHGASGG
jgi:dienelactone hydrolase